MNTKLRTYAKDDSEKNFFKDFLKDFFRRTMENVRKHRDIKIETTGKRRNQLPSEPTYLTKKHFSDNLIAIEMKKTRLKMNKSIYLSIFNIRHQ